MGSASNVPIKSGSLGPRGPLGWGPWPWGPGGSLGWGPWGWGPWVPGGLSGPRGGPWGGPLGGGPRGIFKLFLNLFLEPLGALGKILGKAPRMSAQKKGLMY